MSMPMPIDVHECDASEYIFCALLLGDPYRQGFVPTRKKVPFMTSFRNRDFQSIDGLFMS